MVAFDDAPWAPFVNPPLTVVAQPAYALGTHAADLLTGRIDGSASMPARTVTLSTTLIARASSRRPGHTPPPGEGS